MNVSSVDCCARVTLRFRFGQRNFRFALGTRGGGPLLVKKGGVLGSFLGFSAPRQAGRLGKGAKPRRRPIRG